MRTIMRLRIMMLSVAAVLVTSPTFAETGRPSEPSATELTMEGLEKLMRGIQRMVEDLPRYDLPEITSNGDIILRRIDPPRDEQRHPLIPPPKPGEGVDL